MGARRVTKRTGAKRLAIGGVAVVLAVAVIVAWGASSRVRARHQLLTNVDVSAPAASKFAGPASDAWQGTSGSRRATAAIPSWKRWFGTASAPARDYVPAAIIEPPPRPTAAPPAPPVEPPNPIANRPTMYNPGGVNGDRPERRPAGAQE